MYTHLVERRRDAVEACVQLLRDYSREMALDPRFYRHIGQSSGPGSISSATSSDSSALTGITSPSVLSTSASAATIRSTASSPSLRARESVSIPVGRQDGIASPSPGGNVRVVVRVRKFLQRGMCWGENRDVKAEQNLKIKDKTEATDDLTMRLQNSTVRLIALSRWTPTPR